MERCRYPRTGVVSLTVSPSNLTIKRRTPCVAGCWGPRLTTYSSVPNWDSPPALIWLNNKSVIGEVLSQRKLGVILWHHDTPQVGVTLESDPIEIEHFPLEPIGAFPNALKRRGLCVITI